MALSRLTRRRKMTRPNRRRRYMRNVALVRQPRRIYNRIHKFVRWADTAALFPTLGLGPNQIVEQGGTSGQNLSYSFALNQIALYNEFTVLYDFYKIHKIELFLEPTNNQTTDATSIHIQNYKMRAVHDYVDNFPLLNESQYLEYGNCKSYNCVSSKTHKIVLYPWVNSALENVLGTTNAFSPRKSPWIATRDSSVPHFSIKLYIPPNVSGNIGQVLFNVRVRFTISMKNSK